jgi:hypothetical protein
MAESYIRNKLGNQTRNFRLPCDDTVAVTFMDTFCDGEYAVYSKTATTGSDVATTYNSVSVQVKDTTGLKAYFNMACKSTVSEDEIFTALKGGTWNGVLAEDIIITRMSPVTLA